VALGGRRVPDSFDFTVWADEKCAADDAHEGLAQEFLHASRAVGFDHFEIGIAEEIEVEFLLGFEFGLGGDGIAASAEDDGVELIELLLRVAKLGRFRGSTGSVGLGIEKEDDAAAVEVGERDVGAGIIFEAECGGFVAGFQHEWVSGVA
jgi:hypothetical protein